MHSMLFPHRLFMHKSQQVKCILLDFIDLSIYCFSTASSIGFAVSLNLGFVGGLKFLLWVIFVDCIGVGLIIATLFW